MNRIYMYYGQQISFMLCIIYMNTSFGGEKNNYTYEQALHKAQYLRGYNTFAGNRLLSNMLAQDRYMQRIHQEEKVAKSHSKADRRLQKEKTPKVSIDKTQPKNKKTERTAIKQQINHELELCAILDCPKPRYGMGRSDGLNPDVSGMNILPAGTKRTRASM
jgi:hypothetical protein